MKAKKELLLTTFICLLPILAGVALYDALPETIATHFGVNGEENGWSSRAFAVFGIPGIMAGANLLVQLALSTDPKKKNMSPMLRTISIWVTPLLSVLVSAALLGHALGYDMHIETAAPLLTGLLFLVIGNYLPKTKQSYTMGIRLPWTLASEENWNRTHRVAGFLWVLSGVAIVCFSLMHWWSTGLFLTLIVIMIFAPCIYSYLLYRKGI